MRAHGEAFAGICPANTTYLVAGFILDVLVEIELDAIVSGMIPAGRRDGRCRLPVTDGHEPRKVIVLSELILPPPSYCQISYTADPMSPFRSKSTGLNAPS